MCAWGCDTRTADTCAADICADMCTADMCADMRPAYTRRLRWITCRRGARWWWHRPAMMAWTPTQRRTTRPRCRTTSSSLSGHPPARTPSGAHPLQSPLRPPRKKVFLLYRGHTYAWCIVLPCIGMPPAGGHAWPRENVKAVFRNKACCFQGRRMWPVPSKPVLDVVQSEQQHAQACVQFMPQYPLSWGD